MSSNDKVLIDMAVTNTVNVSAIMAYFKDQEVDLQPYIDAELERRDTAMKEAQAKEAAVRAQIDEAVKRAAEGEEPPPPEQEEEPPGEDSDAPLVFGGDFQGEEAADVVGQDG